ncbi:hypothetical protein CIB84_005489 [Bambusicola thoracicus]|uniref:JHY protein n=1 Tax=Bambusicola thoracicus TaxID=9083 RepID=A0A2P4T319_BAMTH|nr:hypothetical protein CIB84_005489 [Bambusicola thoracicus]
MDASATEYVTVSSPYTVHVRKEGFPQSQPTQPRFHPASLKRSPASEGSIGSELHDCQASDSESLALERQYQLELQQRIRANDELVGLSAGELENDSLEEEDSLEKMSSEKREGAKYATVQYTHRVPKKESDGRFHIVPYFLEHQIFLSLADMNLVANTKTVDEEPVQSALPYPNMKMRPEDKWCLNSQRLKDHQKKWSQRNKVKSKQNLKGRDLSRSDNHQPTERPAKPRSWHYRQHQMSEFQTAPMQAVEQDNSSALRSGLYPNPSVGPDTNTAANSDTCLNNFPACTRKRNKNCQLDRPNGLPHGQQHLHNHTAAPFSPRVGSTSGQAHPNQKKSSSTFNANHQEMVKDQVLPQDCKRHIYATSNLCSPAAFCTVSQLTQTMEQQNQEMSCLREANDLNSFSPLLPLIPHVESDSKVDPERDEGNQVKKSQSNSKGYLMQTEKQKQQKVCKKGSLSLRCVFQPYSSKACINLDVKLGGLGPDYEAIKEKKEKLKQQKEYAQRVKEHNMKNIVLVQRLPTKPKVISSVSRQKALEYAKKIPKPKTFTARQSNEEVKEKRVLLPTLKGASLPPITSLETLQSRHEKEKQVVAAFRTLHISSALK